MKRLAIQLSHELEVPRHDDLQADDRNQASCRDRLTLTETALSSHYCSDFKDTRHGERSHVEERRLTAVMTMTEPIENLPTTPWIGE
jgi:hypothetical protein